MVVPTPLIAIELPLVIIIRKLFVFYFLYVNLSTTARAKRTKELDH